MKSQLKATRLYLGLTQKEVAVKAQMSVRGYQRIEAGERKPMIQTAQKIATALNTTVEELFPVNEDAKTEDWEQPS